MAYCLNYTAQPASVHRVNLGGFTMIPDISQCTWINAAWRANQIKQEVLMIATRCNGQFGYEGLDGEGMRDV